MDASVPLDSGTNGSRDASDARDASLSNDAADLHDAELDAAHDADVDSTVDELCCPVEPSPSCCMAYGGPRFRGCGETCDGMPPPDAPWRLETDSYGCPVWIEPREYDGVCCGCPPPDDDAGY